MPMEKQEAAKEEDDEQKNGESQRREERKRRREAPEGKDGKGRKSKSFEEASIDISLGASMAT